MSGKITMLKPSPMAEPQAERMTVTPEYADALLSNNNNRNRPIREQHAQRIAAQIRAGKWRLNGDTIKIADDGDVLDGQHRLWAIILAGVPVESYVVRGVARDAFATIDAIRQSRTGADTLALCGHSRYRQDVSAALKWLLLWQRGVLAEHRLPANRIENSDIEAAFAAHPLIAPAVERAMKLRNLGNPGLIGFFFYVLGNRDVELAERMIATLQDPARVDLKDPFFLLRVYFTADHHKRKDPVMTVALMVKAANAARRGQGLAALVWRPNGVRPEKFPTLDV